MTMNTLLRLLTLTIALTGTSAQGNFTKNVIDVVSGAMTSIDCDDDTRATSQCNLAPFRGTYTCRTLATLFGRKVTTTVCARNIIQGFTLGAQGDVCGCCEDTGCPVTCGCPCGDDGTKVMVTAKLLFGLVNTERCVSNGWSQHMQAWGGENVSCTGTDNCAALQDSETETIEASNTTETEVAEGEGV